MDNSSNPVTSHPALAHMGLMDLVGNHRTNHGSGGACFLCYKIIFYFCYCLSTITKVYVINVVTPYLGQKLQYVRKF